MSTTSRTKHTPGPWNTVILNGDRIAVVAHDSSDVATLTQASHADARLIAAAPELLAALEAAIPALIRLGDFVGNVDPGGASGMGRIDRCALILQAREAIAKAKEV